MRIAPPAGFELRVLALAPGARLAYDAAEWEDALVTVELGSIELVCLNGSRQRFVSGAVLWLAGLPLQVIRNPEPHHALLLSVCRERRSVRNVIE